MVTIPSWIITSIASLDMHRAPDPTVCDQVMRIGDLSCKLILDCSERNGIPRRQRNPTQKFHGHLPTFRGQRSKGRQTISEAMKREGLHCTVQPARGSRLGYPMGNRRGNLTSKLNLGWNQTGLACGVSARSQPGCGEGG